MKTKYWKAFELFDKPVNGRDIQLVKSDIRVPVEIESLIDKHWEKQLKEKQAELKKACIETEIQELENGIKALYENGISIMWPGPCVSLNNIELVGKYVDLCVIQTSFPYIEASKDPEIIKQFKGRKLPVPKPPLAVCTYAVTQDEHLVLTVRGLKTTVYPGRYYGAGGNLETVNSDIISSQEEEIADEILVNKDEYNSDEFYFGDIVIDKEGFPKKPDLVGWLPVNLESIDIMERTHKRRQDERPNDASNVLFISSQENILFDYLAKTDPRQFCPSAHAGLIVYGKHHFGKKWAEDLLKRIQ